MGNLLFILLLAFLSSCYNSTTEQIEGKGSDKTELKIKGVETCNCPTPFDKAGHQIKIKYQKNFLKFCAFEYSVFDKTATEFRIFDKNDSLVFPGDAPFVYKVSELKAPFRLTQFIEIAFDDTAELKSVPAVEYQIVEQGGQFKLNEKFVLKPPIMSKQKMDSLMAVFRRQPLHFEKYDENDPPFATEEFETDMFICAVNGNQECLEAFENLETRFATDGAIAELYSELDYLLQIYKKNKVK